MINRIRMVLPAQDLRRHIPRRATRISRIIRPESPRNPEIRNPHVAFLIEY